MYTSIIFLSTVFLNISLDSVAYTFKLCNTLIHSFEYFKHIEYFFLTLIHLSHRIFY